nr:CDP-archaeol synthase [Euryarchaeota archaeon]
EVSSKAPLLDTLPFAIFTFIFGLLFLSPAIASDTVLVKGMVILLVMTPIIHRSFNVLGYKLGLKSVPY